MFTLTFFTQGTIQQLAVHHLVYVVQNSPVVLPTDSTWQACAMELWLKLIKKYGFKTYSITNEDRWTIEWIN